MNMDAGDVQALAELEQAGSDLSKPHLVDFYLYFPNREGAEGIAKILRNEGYQVTVRLGADNVNWLCFARKAIILSHQTIASLRAHFEMLVTPRHGEYDGWEAAVVG